MTDNTNELVSGAALCAASLAPAAGVGDVFKHTREFIEESLKPTVTLVVDPESGLSVLAKVDGGSLEPLPANFFDSVRDHPRFRRGTAALTSLDSFIGHVVRFGDKDTAVFADDNKLAPKLTALLDYHRADTDGEHGEYRHGKHRTTFNFPLSDEWKAWLKSNGVVMSMADFSLFLEDRIGDIAIAGDNFPEHVERFVNSNGGVDSIADFATLVELATGLKVYETANVEETTNLASGEGKISFSVDHETRGRSGGVVKVPRVFFISIPIFSKGAFYRIGARLRYRKTGEGVKFWYDLYRHDLSFDHAFDEAVKRVDDETPAAVFYGAPEA